MEVFQKIIEGINTYVIYGLPSGIILLALIKKLLSSSKVSFIKSVIKWIILSVTGLGFLHYLIGFIVLPEEFAFLNRATGPYWFSYWLMMICAIFLPWSLLIHKLGKNLFYLFLVSVLIRIGFYMERWIIFITSIHRDYMPDETDYSIWVYPLAWVISSVLKGLVLLVILVGIATLIFRLKRKHE